MSTPDTRDPATPLWRGVVLLRVVTWLFAFGVVVAHRGEFHRGWLAWTVVGVMGLWTLGTSVAYARQGWRLRWLVIADVVVTTGLMLTSPFILSDVQYAEAAPLITTVWAAVGPLAAAVRFGAGAGVAAGLVVAVGTGVARERLDLDVFRDGVLLCASSLLIGMAATTARRSAEALAKALRTEAATAERERLARSIHDSVLQVLARVRRRGLEVGGEAAELAKLAGEQEIALRALVTTEPTWAGGDGTADLRSALQLLATTAVQVATPAGTVDLPAPVTAELVAAVREALSNVEKHAGPDARAWVLLEDLGDEIVVSIRDDGPGIPEGRLARAEAEGHLGVVKSIKGRMHDLGGTAVVDSAEGRGTEWELRMPSTTRDGR